MGWFVQLIHRWNLNQLCLTFLVYLPSLDQYGEVRMSLYPFLPEFQCFILLQNYEIIDL